MACLSRLMSATSSTSSATSLRCAFSFATAALLLSRPALAAAPSFSSNARNETNNIDNTTAVTAEKKSLRGAGQQLGGNCDVTDWCLTDDQGNVMPGWDCFPNCERCDQSAPPGDYTDWCGGDAQNGDVFDNGNGCNDFWDTITQENWCNNFQGRLAEISCTPFPIKYKYYASPDNWDWCKDNEVINWYTAWDANSPRYSDGAQAWWDSEHGADNFFVFHGCDGAGTQMGDCGGGIMYLEQFGPRCDWGNDDCAFRHPGTGTAYKWYWCGWWSTDNQYVDKSKPWWDVTGLGDSDSPRTALLYPWEDPYGNTGQNLEWYWGGDAYGSASGQQEHVGWIDFGDKWICNNEPMDNDHWSTTSIPASLANGMGAYKLWDFEDGRMKVENAYTGDIFHLDKMAYPPW